MSQEPHRTQDAVRRTVSMLALIFASALPAVIAIVLVASTNDDGNPLDRIPDYGDPLVETLTVPLDSVSSVQTHYRYFGRVRLVFEGSGVLPDGTSTDVFYRFSASGRASAAPTLAPALAVDGVPVLDALELSAGPPDYADDHLYSALYDLRGDYRRLRFSVIGGGAGADGALTITVVQIR